MILLTSLLRIRDCKVRFLELSIWDYLEGI